MKMTYMGIGLMALMLLPLASASEDFTQAKQLLDQKIPYSELTDNQFEMIGDYFMELMAGENHAYMDQMMGGEGSESLRQAHINMGENYYEQYQRSGSLQNTGMMGSGTGMMGNGFVGNSNTLSPMHTGSYANTGTFWNGFLWFVCVVIVSFVFGITFWWTKKLVGNKK